MIPDRTRIAGRASTASEGGSWRPAPHQDLGDDAGNGATRLTAERPRC
jgi:hypothetical protein